MKTIELYGGELLVLGDIPLKGKNMAKIKTLTRKCREHPVAVRTYADGIRIFDAAFQQEIEQTKPEYRRELEIAGLRTEILCTATDGAEPMPAAGLTDQDIQSAIRFNTRSGSIYSLDDDLPYPESIIVDFTRMIRLYGGNLRITSDILLTNEIMERIKTLTRQCRERPVAAMTRMDGATFFRPAGTYDFAHAKPDAHRWIEVAGFKTEILHAIRNDGKEPLASDLTDEDIQGAIRFNTCGGYVYYIDDTLRPENIAIDFDFDF